jgi:two-component system sensor kinase FixL
LKTGQVVLANSPEADPRSSGRPDGHPPLNSFLGIPFQSGDELVGMIGVANREGGYSEELIGWLQPLTDTCTTMIAAMRSERDRQSAEKTLRESEEHFRRIAELTTEVTFVAEIDTAGTALLVSMKGNIQHVLGVTEEDALGAGWEQFIHPEDSSRIARLIEASQKNETAQEVVRWNRPDGEERWLQVSVAGQTFSEDIAETRSFRVTGCVVDITSAMKSEQTLRDMVDRHQAILQAVPDFIFLATRDGQFIETWAGDDSQILVPADQLVGRQHRNLLPAEVCEEWDAAVVKAESTEEPATFDYSLEIDGETRWFEARVVACCRERKAVLTVVRDITDRWDAEEAEARQFALLKAISDNSSELIFVKDNEGRVQFVNQAAADIFAHTTENLVGTTAEDIFPDEVCRKINDSDRQVLEFGQAVRYEEILPGADCERTYLTSKTPWRSRSGEILGLIGIAQDITELKQTHLELDQSRRFVESIADASPHVISVFDVISNRIAYANRRFEEILRLVPAEITSLGEDLLPTLIHPDDLPAVYETLSRLETSPDGEVIEQQCRIRTGSGEWRWWLSRTTVFKRTDDGRLQQIISTTQDVTERVNAQRALEESEARLRAIIEQEPECVKLVARDGTLLEMNSAGLSFTGADSLEEVVGLCVFDLIAPEYQQAFRDFHEKVCGGEAGTLEMEIIGLKGERRRMETHAVPLKYGPDGEIGHLAITRDVTDVRRAEELIAEHQSQLLHVSRLSSLGQMAAAISHEITQPLSAISNYAAACRLLLKREQPDLETFKRHIETIAAQTHRAGETLDRIRTFIRGGDSPKQRCDIGEVIAGALDLMKAELRNRQVRVEFRSPETLPAVMADRIQIQQVITNLVTNACDAMQQLPEHERTVDIICQHDSDHIVINVEDTGLGLNDLSQETLFEAFSTSKSEGMGLGLAICRDIVTAHGGTIVAANARTRGAVLQFTLPVSKEA